MRKSIFFLALLVCFSFAAKAQKPDSLLLRDSTQVKKDSAQIVKDIGKPRQDSIKAAKTFAPKSKPPKIYYPDSTHNVSKAWHRSLMVPGWGQLYNGKWWKVPIIYTSLGLIAAAYLFNQKYYSQNLAIAQYRRRGTEPTPGDKYYEEFTLYKIYNYPDQAITDAVKGYARYRDISVLGFAAMWGIQCIDAYIDAKFKHSYSMDNNFSMKIAPTIMDQPMYAQSDFNGSFIPGIKITFTLR